MTDDQFQELMAVLTSISESLRILCDAVEWAASNDEEEGKWGPGY